jgi:hypothetical protein
MPCGSAVACRVNRDLSYSVPFCVRVVVLSTLRLVCQCLADINGVENCSAGAEPEVTAPIMRCPWHVLQESCSLGSWQDWSSCFALAVSRERAPPLKLETTCDVCSWRQQQPQKEMCLESGPRTRFLVHVRCLASSERLNLLISLHHPLFAFYCLLKLGLSSEEKGRCSNA